MKALLKFCGTPCLMMSSDMCKTRCILIVLLHMPFVRGETNLNNRMSHLVAFWDWSTILFEILSCFNHASHCKREERSVIQSVTCDWLPRPSSWVYFGLLEKMSMYSLVCMVNNMTRRHPGTSSAIRCDPADRPFLKTVRGRSLSLWRLSRFPTFVNNLSYCLMTLVLDPACAMKASIVYVNHPSNTRCKISPGTAPKMPRLRSPKRTRSKPFAR